jgi:hypothetical protein
MAKTSRIGSPIENLYIVAIADARYITVLSPMAMR